MGVPDFEVDRPTFDLTKVLKVTPAVATLLAQLCRHSVEILASVEKLNEMKKGADGLANLFSNQFEKILPIVISCIAMVRVLHTYSTQLTWLNHFEPGTCSDGAVRKSPEIIVEASDDFKPTGHEYYGAGAWFAHRSESNTESIFSKICGYLKFMVVLLTVLGRSIDPELFSRCPGLFDACIGVLTVIYEDGGILNCIGLNFQPSWLIQAIKNGVQYWVAGYERWAERGRDFASTVEGDHILGLLNAKTPGQVVDAFKIFPSMVAVSNRFNLVLLWETWIFRALQAVLVPIVIDRILKLLGKHLKTDEKAWLQEVKSSFSGWMQYDPVFGPVSALVATWICISCLCAPILTGNQGSQPSYPTVHLTKLLELFYAEHRFKDAALRHMEMGQFHLGFLVFLKGKDDQWRVSVKVDKLVVFMLKYLLSGEDKDGRILVEFFMAFRLVTYVSHFVIEEVMQQGGENMNMDISGVVNDVHRDIVDQLDPVEPPPPRNMSTRSSTNHV